MTDTATPYLADQAPTEPLAHNRTLWALGLGGLIPFVALSAVLIYAGRDFIAFDKLVLAFTAYSAVILSFLGGIRWGASLMTGVRTRGTLVLSVVPSIMAWILVLVPAPWCFAGFALAFLAQGAWDIAAIRRGQLPAEFGRLRLVLTAVVVLCEIAATLSTL
ncbi:DUF3429 domain-containing protein [Aureimonas glaciei]|jgi:hypothetical protein|uniref:DUF3429 domain-containing protein n=1 Tax=Aureimonas glaciei TaxID=1776957 RepID=A0A916XTL4_9HYPH|nr:DUF3429 domain-containing protein [Aureimonas glaciei]GGD09259.1 hypothetical protein GCM10011335_10140 [Aureimonas glaciei]